MEALASVLDPDAVGLFDSGGVIPGAPLESVVGATTIARILVATTSHRGAECTVASVNGEPGVVMSLDGWVAAVVSLTFEGDRITVVRGVGNPAKLRAVAVPPG